MRRCVETREYEAVDEPLALTAEWDLDKPPHEHAARDAQNGAENGAVIAAANQTDLLKNDKKQHVPDINRILTVTERRDDPRYMDTALQLDQCVNDSDRWDADER